MKAKQARTVTVGGTCLALLFVLWLVAGPRQIGGPSSYVITQGVSMLPLYSEGDLVVTRQTDGYEEGDIVAYRSASLDQIVLHRIVGQDDRGFITKGDNNNWRDTDRPKSAEVLGKAWFHLPGVGRWLGIAASPAGVAVIVALIGGLFLLGSADGTKTKREGGPRVPRVALQSFTDRQKRTLLAPAVLLGAFFLLAIVSYRQPVVSAITADAAYKHVGRFDYSADVPKSPVYPEGVAEPGRPIFLNLVDRLTVRFDYAIEAEAPHLVSGEALMFARVTGATGWKKAIPIATEKRFDGGQVHLAGDLDLVGIQRLVREVQTVTGLPETNQTVELVARVSAKGTMAGEPIEEEFSPQITMVMDPLQLQVRKDTDTTSPAEILAAFEQTRPGQVSTEDMKVNRLNILGWSSPIDAARRVATSGSLMMLVILGVLWLRFSSPAHANEAAFIEGKYGDWLIPVESIKTETRSTSVQVKSIEALVRLAELYERMILHESRDGTHSYYVEEEGVLYYYRPVIVASPEDAPSTPRFSGRKSREDRRKQQVERLRRELSDIEAEVLREKAAPSED